MLEDGLSWAFRAGSERGSLLPFRESFLGLPAPLPAGDGLVVGVQPLTPTSPHVGSREYCKENHSGKQQGTGGAKVGEGFVAARRRSGSGDVDQGRDRERQHPHRHTVEPATGGCLVRGEHTAEIKGESRREDQDNSWEGSQSELRAEKARKKGRGDAEDYQRPDPEREKDAKKNSTDALYHAYIVPGPPR